jgi:hypothetical protein
VPKDKVDLPEVLVARHTRLYGARAQIQKMNRELNGVLDRVVESKRVEFPKKGEKGDSETHGESAGS